MTHETHVHRMSEEVSYIEALTVSRSNLHRLATFGYVTGDDETGWTWTADGTRWINERMRGMLTPLLREVAESRTEDLRRDVTRFRATLGVIAEGKWPIGMSPREYAEATLDDT